MQPHPNRDSEDEVMVLIKKETKKAKGDANMTLFRVQVYLLDIVKKKADGYQVVKFQTKPKFDVVAHHEEQAVSFTLGELGELLPVELRGGGIGSLIMSELIKWAKSHVGDYAVKPIKVYAPPDEGGESLQRNKSFLKNLGLELQEDGSSGVFGVAEAVKSLNTHANTQKLERVDMPGWLGDLAVVRAGLGNQMEEEISNARFYKEQLQREKESNKGKLSFWAGLMLGAALATVGCVLIFAM